MQLTTSRSKRADVVFGNARALLLIQVANLLLPLILIPYLARVLGADLYGVTSFGLAIVQVASVITDYGFNLSATAEISKHRDRTAYINRLIGAVFLCKSLLLTLVVPAVVAFAIWNNKYSAHTTFLILLTLPLAAQTFQPLWFFQGIEKMKWMALFTLASRLLYLVLVFAYVTTPSDYVLLALANGASQLLALGLALTLMLKAGYRPAWPNLDFAWKVARDSTQFFWSRAAVSTYTAGGAVFLGLFSMPSQVAYYAAADQLYRGAQALFAPLSQALYPNMARTHNFALLFKVVKCATAISVAAAIVGAVAGQWAVSLLFGSAFAESYPVLLVLLVALAVNTPSVLLGYPLLGALGHAYAANLSVLLAGALQLILLATCLVLGWIQAFHVAVIVLVVETVVLLLRVYWGRRHYREWRASASCVRG